MLRSHKALRRDGVRVSDQDALVLQVLVRHVESACRNEAVRERLHRIADRLRSQSAVRLSSKRAS